MKKLFVLLLLLFTTDSYSSGISGNVASAPCDNDTLSKYNGTADVEINWEPNTIGLKWFNGEEQINGQTSCVYDGTITVPPQPTKPGYTFNGWKIPKIDFSTIPTDINGTERWSIGWYNNANYCWYDTTTGSAQNVNCNSDTTYNELQTHEWKVRFEHGDLYGISLCSNTTNGKWGQPGTPTTETGAYCWCKAIGYKPSGSNVVNISLSTLPWIHDGDISGSKNTKFCIKMCASHCATYAGYNDISFRYRLLHPANN